MSVRLKCVEIADFKSYYGKHVLGPLPSFTAVVGPNGGGKSNILDAIAFGFGIELPKLRVSHIHQLIHRDKAKDGSTPASVTIVFTLPDDSEKTFKRVLSNQGSEFMVDGLKVSVSAYMRNLQELGITSQQSNFIFQGCVELIALYDSKETVKLFEEISGSGALKKEYNRLKKEMTKTKEKLTDDFDKLNMMADQYRTLKDHRKHELKYEELEKEFMKQSTNLRLFRLYRIGSTQKTLQEELEVKDGILKELEEKERKLAENLEITLKNQSVVIEEIGNVEQKVGELEIQLSKRRSELITAKECLASKSSKMDVSSKLLIKAKEAQEDQLRKVEDLKKELEKTEVLVVQFEKRLAEEALKMGKSVHLEGEQLKQYHQLKQQVGHCCVTLQQKVDYLSRQLRTHLDQMADKNRQMEERQDALRRKQEEVQDLKKRREKLTMSLKLKKESLEKKREVLKDLQKEVTCKRDKVMELQSELVTLTDNLNEATWDVHEAQRNTKKQEVLEILRIKFPGVYNRLKDLCVPIHSRYRVAITRVLLKHLDSIVVDNEVTARRCIQYLYDQRMDRETFLPLNYLRTYPLKESLRAIEEPRNVKLAFDLIAFQPPEAKMAVLFATNNVLVCETPEDAMKVAYEIGEMRLSAVALDGTFFTKSGLLSGGKLDLEKKAKSWTEKNVANMRTRKDEVMAELRKLQKVAREESEMKTLGFQVQGLEAQVKYTSLELDRLNKQEKELEEQLIKMESELMIPIDHLKKMQSDKAEHEMEMMEVKDEMKKKENEIFEEFCREIGIPDISLFEQEGLQILMEREQERLKFEKQKSRIMSLISFEENRDLEIDVKKWEAAIAAQTEALEKVKEEEKKKIDEVKATMVKVAEAKSKMVKKGQALREAGEMVDAVQEKARVTRREREKMKYRVSGIKQMITSLKMEKKNILEQCHIKGIKLPLLSGSLQQAVGHASDSSASTMETSSEMQSTSQSEPNIEVDFSFLSTKYRNLETEEQRNDAEEHIFTKISKLEENLRSLQPPKKKTRENLRELDQHVKARRIAFKEKQLQARRAKNAFESVKKQRLKLFSECFSFVSDRIDNLFKTLWGNNAAQALLVTDNQEEPYLGSVLYHCIPPGKRCQQMVSLSGGEKAIASLALLFALHSYNPASFFILDEVDAALDKTNICRMASYLCEHKDEMQVVVISHKERLYRKADALFGITFRTSGYSTMFSFDLVPYRRRNSRTSHGHQSLSSQSSLTSVEISEEAV